ncbi:MAG: toll/interleukin-1 receptor domain-containing protein, partial [Anaerolineae bacterium]|nr:toll/interleukin-1 receptor domain-containing protein [Anaerolineae bacterium]
MTSIFISYGRTERPLIKQIATQLRRIYGEKQVWYDEDIAGGQHWESVLRNEIAARDIFLFMISAKSVQSEYCIWEAKEALRLEKKILPVLIEPLPASEIPDVLDDFQYIDISEVAGPGGALTAEHILKLATAITPLSQEYQIKWQQKRRRTTLWRAALLSLAAIFVGAVITLAVTNNPPFPGGIAYVAAHENNVEIRVIDGGV